MMTISYDKKNEVMCNAENFRQRQRIIDSDKEYEKCGKDIHIEDGNRHEKKQNLTMYWTVLFRWIWPQIHATCVKTKWHKKRSVFLAFIIQNFLKALRSFLPEISTWTANIFSHNKILIYYYNTKQILRIIFCIFSRNALIKRSVRFAKVFPFQKKYLKGGFYYCVQVMKTPF